MLYFRKATGKKSIATIPPIHLQTLDAIRTEYEFVDPTAQVYSNPLFNSFSTV
jgi:hypothetical protein